jgi:hypothetical protein
VAQLSARFQRQLNRQDEAKVTSRGDHFWISWVNLYKMTKKKGVQLKKNMVKNGDWVIAKQKGLNLLSGYD